MWTTDNEYLTKNIYIYEKKRSRETLSRNLKLGEWYKWKASGSRKSILLWEIVGNEIINHCYFNSFTSSSFYNTRNYYGNPSVKLNKFLYIFTQFFLLLLLNFSIIISSSVCQLGFVFVEIFLYIFHFFSHSWLCFFFPELKLTVGLPMFAATRKKGT